MKFIIKSQINLKPILSSKGSSVVLLYICTSVLFAKRQEINLKGENDQPMGCSGM